MVKQNVYRDKFILQLQGRDFINIIIIAITWIFALILVNPIGDFPLNDDWAYAESVKHLLETGDFQLPGWAVANLLPQVLFGALFCLPFGFSFTALRFSTLTLGLIGIIATYGLLKEVSHQRIALIGALIVAVNPLYFALANTFMTDVPHYAVTVLSLYFFVIGIKKNSLTTIVISVVIAVISLLIRQTTIALFAGYAIAYVVKNKAKIKSLIMAALLFVLLPAGVQLLFSAVFWPKNYGNYGVKEQEIVSQLVGADTSAIAQFAYFALCALLYLGCFLLPWLLIVFALQSAGIKSQGRKIQVSLLLFLITSVGVWLVVKQTRMPLRGNVINDWGIGPLTLRDTILSPPGTIPNYLAAFWIVVTIFSVVGAGLLLLFLVLSTIQLLTTKGIANKRSLILLSNSTIFIYFLPLGISFFFDRYLILLLPLLMMMVLTTVGKIPQVKLDWKTSFVSWLIILFIGAFTVGTTHDYLSWNRIRWQAIENLIQEQQISPRRIDGGFEFNGWYLYSSDYPVYKNRKAEIPWWWVEQDDYLVAFSPVAGYDVVKQYSLENWLPFKFDRILVLQKTDVARLIANPNLDLEERE
ncbi:glycosyltransferase family 39 protein [Pleurocapsales cyanobacterium LEGE 10410]|nr:glycosyltransferase family 39 protein [Pleurocapsales cyanobacterium LEGE 10410]